MYMNCYVLLEKDKLGQTISVWAARRLSHPESVAGRFSSKSVDWTFYSDISSTVSVRPIALLNILVHSLQQHRQMGHHYTVMP